jgi:putative ATP-binding cassette transporter
MRTTGFLKAFWALTKPYWVSEKRAVGLTLLVTVVGLAMMLVWLELQFNTWNRDFYNTFESRDQLDFFLQLGLFGLLALIYIITFVYRQYFQQMLLIEWRTWLTEHFLADWLKGQAHYRMQLLDRGTDNPDQRIAEDLRIFVDLTLSLFVGFLSAVATLIVFSVVLWQLSGVLKHWNISIPGDLLWVAVVYAVFGTLLTHLIGKPLIRLDFNQQRFEADFRFSLVRLRENSEGVALYGGEQQEEGGLRGRFIPVISNWWALMYKQKQLTWFTAFYAQLATIFPFVVAAPGFFAGTITLGVIFQTASAFGQVQSSLSWFINAYTTFAQWKATVDRLIGFTESMDRVREEADRLDGDRVTAPGESVALEQLEIALPQGAPLLAATSIELKPGENVLVTGPSGSGKSTFFRSLAGIWPYWKGRIRLPQGARLLFLPQKPYLPLGSLKHAVTYPEKTEKFGDAEIGEALRAVGLAHLSGDLERTENWAQVLSGGEQQRLAFARALLNKPDWLFLDEATSALPDPDQDALYRLLRQTLPRTTLVSVGHRESLAVHHERRLAWHDRRLGVA